ncbi:MAG: protease modulator HflC, partial [Gammaproteobacteria bacterium]
RDEFSERPLQEVVAGDRGMVMDLVENKVTKIAEQLGIVIEDVRTMKIDLPENVSVSVYQRMRAERERVARDFRARGNEAAERIRANADREREVIVANAFRKAETIRGEGDAEATGIYAEAYNMDREFYDFYRSTTAYLNGFNAENSILLLQPDSEFFKYFSDPSGIKPVPRYER